jgi:hypothetical protein
MANLVNVPKVCLYYFVLIKTQLLLLFIVKAGYSTKRDGIAANSNYQKKGNHLHVLHAARIAKTGGTYFHLFTQMPTCNPNLCSWMPVRDEDNNIMGYGVAIHPGKIEQVAEEVGIKRTPGSWISAGVRMKTYITGNPKKKKGYFGLYLHKKSRVSKMYAR